MLRKAPAGAVFAILLLVLPALAGCDVAWLDASLADGERRCAGRDECPAASICVGATATEMGVCRAGEGTDSDGDGVALEEGDCDDTDPAIHPGLPEVCDGRNNDCDEATTVAGEDQDVDGDGSPPCADCDDADAANFPGNAEVCDEQDNDCDPSTLFAGEASDADGDDSVSCRDCDDFDADRFPGNPEACDGGDNDCDEATLAGGDEGDADGDGSLACEDCDDGDASNTPGQVERCDGADNDCVGGADYSLAGGDESDGDGDGFLGCEDDCDDADGAVFPGAAEVCDGVDGDCDGDLVDEDVDTDGDDVPDCVDVDDDGDGTADGSDCAPGDPAIYPNAPETCDAVDSDCDGDLVDGFTDLDGDAEPDCVDTDDDGDGAPDDADGDGVVDPEDDCAPLDAANHPGNTELCDGQDNDCNGLADAGQPGSPSAEADVDGDGYRPCDGDCDDSAAGVHPGAAEQCNGVDDDCDPATGAPAAIADPDGSEQDTDEDGQWPCQGDCDDDDDLVFLGAWEVCDGADNDCTGGADYVDSGGNELDADGDGFLGCDDDCDDGDGAVHPGAVESCDAVDSDCDDELTDGAPDLDGDGAPDCIDTDDDGDGTADGSDCGPQDATIFPNAPESCDAIDSDCDGDLVDPFDDHDGDGAPDCIDEDDDGDGVPDDGNGDGLLDPEDDCAPLDPANYPGNVEICDGQDNDCNGLDDVGQPGVGGAETDGDGDGIWPCAGDCDDSRVAVHPGSVELCNGLDDDCDPATEALAAVPDPDGHEFDTDGDGQWPCQGDCDDDDDALFLGALETCNGLDDDCVGGPNFGGGQFGGGETDEDSDGHLGCLDDCDDDNATVYSGAPERCDAVDSDCDGDVPEDFANLDGDGLPDCADDDADGDGAVVSEDCDDLDAGSTLVADDGDCDGVEASEDCDDGDPGSTYLADDPDCDGVIDCGITSTAGDMTFRRICAGTFAMGCTAGQLACDSDETEHAVTLTRGFWMAETEATQGQWQALIGNNPAWYGSCGADCPIENVTWFDALEAANALSAQEGLDACYLLSDCFGSPGSALECVTVEVNSPSGSPYDCEGYRLPTEAEWEYAARAGTDLLYAGSDDVDVVAWWSGNSGGSTKPVATRAANPWGLYDMSGNVREWTWDWYQHYSFNAPVDPTGSGNGAYKLARGGCYSDGALLQRVADRDKWAASTTFPRVGFRVVRTAF